MIPVYVIHLPNPERKQRIAAELDRAGFTDITYVHAKEPCPGFHMSNMRRNPRGEFGCALSHVKALLTAYRNSEKHFGEALIVEDDVVFVEGASDVLDNAIDEAGDIFDPIYLGGHPRGPVEVYNKIYGAPEYSLVTAPGWSCAEAYYIHDSTVLGVIEYWLERAGQPNAMWDFVLGEYAAKHGAAIYPSLAHQPPGWSHIGQKHDDKTHLYEKGWRENLQA